MKKTYSEPIMKVVAINCAKMIAGSLAGEGVNMRISNDNATGAAESRRGGNVWDDEE